MSRARAQREDAAERRSVREPRPWQPSEFPPFEALEAAQRALWGAADPVPLIAWEAAQVRASAELELLVLLQPDLRERLSALGGKVTARRVAEEARQVVIERTRAAWAPVSLSPPPPESDLSRAARADQLPRCPPEWHAAVAAIARLEAVAEVPAAGALRKAARADLLSVLAGVLWTLSAAPGPDDVLSLERRRAGGRKAGAARKADRKGKPATLTPRVAAEYQRAAGHVRREFTRLGAARVAERVLESWAGSSDPELAAAACLSPAYVAQRLGPEVNSRKA